MIYDTNLEVAALILSVLCLIYVVSAKRRQYRIEKSIKGALMNQHFIFLCTLVSVIISCIASVGGHYLQNIASKNVVGLQYALHEIYFLFHNALSLCFALYVMHVNGSSRARGRLFYIIFSIPFVLSELMVVTNRFTSFVFYMDEQCYYHRGSFINLLYVFGTMYFLIGFVSYFRYQKAISKTDRITFGILLSISAVGIILQGLKSFLIVELFTESLTLAGLMMLLEDRSGHVDPVTGVLNRVAMVDDFRRLIETNQSFSIVLVKLTDIDLFSKLFNGREMDTLLVQISEWLTSISSEQRLFYYRSNDFALLYNGNDNRDIKAITDSILERFEGEWKN